MAENRKAWLVEFPTYQYNEDVKELARKNNLIVYDARFADQIPTEWVEASPPKLTKVGEAKRGRPAQSE
jgi:hypothetical protein